jgi:hypothetical protein
MYLNVFMSKSKRTIEYFIVMRFFIINIFFHCEVFSIFFYPLVQIKLFKMALMKFGYHTLID